MMKLKARTGVILMALLVVMVNAVIFYHTWHFTHFCSPSNKAFEAPDKMSWVTKISALFTGMYNPKMPDDSLPRVPYQRVKLLSIDSRVLDAWYIPSNGSTTNNTTVILLHGFKGNKSNMLPIADYFLGHDMNCFLIDFSGHGNSDGFSSTVGYLEGREVQLAYQYVKKHTKGPVILYGSSMGAVAAIYAVGQYGLQPDKIILEAPYGSMLQAVNNRCAMQGLPAFPLSQIILFWGSVQDGLWAFNNKPAECAKYIKTPTLLLYGINDHKVSLPETNSIFANLQGEKQLHLFSKSAHTSFWQTEPIEWENTINNFLFKAEVAETP